MIRKFLMISAASLAIAGCGNNGNGDGGGPSLSLGQKSSQEQLAGALNASPKHGLTTDLFFKGDTAAAGEGDLRSAVLNYASALANGKVDPTKIRDVYTIPRPKVEVEAGLDQALSENKLAEWLDSLAPQTAEYKALSNAFVQLVESSPDLAGASIPATGDVIKQGGTDPRVPAVAQNLRAQGYLAAQPQAGGAEQGQQNDQAQQGQQAPQAQPTNVFTPELSKALAQWQADSGLKPDGVVGPNTVEALNGGPKDRARKLAVAMERLRWLEREPPATRIDVNTAATMLTYFRDGQPRNQRRVVVGEPGWETPQLGSPMYQLVANPTWTVPKSIAEDEISKKSNSWLQQNNFIRKDGYWVQQPGPDNALGEVKFDMKNDEAIYLHDTPAKALFSQDERHRSHGCVRVQNALQFARMLAQDDGVLDKFNKAMATGDQTFVDLNAEIPVRLVYHTAFLGDNGRVQYAQDAYGWDNDVATALGYEARRVARVQHRAGDVGP
ncbi:MAG: L,D-transpeptidase family protein [Sphingomonas sp.]|nr:L,D-transpeptidase family protein [Sphingomonas sp.]